MKGYIRIGGAVLCGIAVIAGAFYARSHFSTTQDGMALVVEAPPKEYIETLDENQNGIPDWEDELTKNIIASINTASSSVDAEETYTPPTTFTGKFSEAFFKDYLAGKAGGGAFEDPEKLVNSAVKSIEKSTESKRYSRLEIVVVPNSPTDIREYGNRVAGIVQEHPSEGRFEAVILQRALEANDPTLLEELTPVRKSYEAMLRDTLLVPVPQLLVAQHLALLNAYEAILTDIKAMEIMFEDPLYGLARVKRYQQDATDLVTALKEISRALIEGGVTYANDEPGAFFYLFDS